MRFTPHQERALDTSRHLAVTANAGSGKTQVLVERYVRLLLQGVPVGEVVALTYTEKAASELKRKIADRIRGALLADLDAAATARLESIRDALPSAFIGTIHSFCSRILREYPVEAGIDAGFSQLEKVDGEIMLRECMGDALGEILRGQDPGVPAERFMDLLRGHGKGRVLQVLGSLVAKRDLLERFTAPGGVYTQPDDAVLALWESLLRDSVRGALDSTTLLRDIGAIVARAGQKRRAEAEEAFAALGRGDDLARRAAAFGALTGMMFTKSGDIARRFVAEPGAAEDLARAAERIAEKRRLLDPLIDGLLNGTITERNRALLGDVRVFLGLARAVVGSYDARKEEEARLDFDDLQLRMRLLLRDVSVRRELAARFRYVMVDEFQDTNPLQLEILLPLMNDLASGNLFIVGDPKQSIYRFRDADVEVFDRSRVAIAAAAGESSRVSLGESFRPLRDVVAFVNLLFGDIMGGTEGGVYDLLVRARANVDPGAVELLLPLPEEEGGVAQADLIVRRILSLVAGETIVYGRDEHPRPAGFRDIALLLRSRSGLEEFEQAFIRGGVPYVVSAGVGYFQTQDVYDMYNYLRFLLDTSDDVALAGILRAPFFTVSDAALFNLARARGRRTLWESLRDPASPGRNVPSLAHAAEVLEGDVPLGPRLPAAELIARIIRRTGFTAALAGTVRGPQAGANLGKLLVMARAYESQGYTSLYDFVGRLQQLIEEEEKEGQAAIESQTDAVRIMTIHAAKGLEFPVVVVSDLQRTFQFDEEPFFDAATGIGLAAAGGSVAAPLSVYLKERARRKGVEEEQRIFYVACTRARDRLVLSSEATHRRDSWMEWLFRCCERYGQSVDAGPVRFDVVTPRFGEPGPVAENHELVVPVIRALPGAPGVPAPAAAARRDVRIDLSPIASRSKGEIFSASRIRSYVECPAKYYFRYVVGVPGGGGPFVPGPEEEFSDGDYPAELRGRVFHSVMEKAEGLPRELTSVEAAVQAALSREAPFAAGGYPSLVPDVARLVLGVLDSGAWKEIIEGSDSRTEYAISAALGEDFITGTIDRLYRGADGVWTVLDYKTDSVGAGGLGDRAGIYWAQLEFYALMVRRLCDAGSVRIRLLFAHHPDVRLERVLGEADLLREEKTVADIIGGIKSGLFSSSTPHCHGCPMHPRPCLTT